MFIVYRHINKINGKSYIGITCQGIAKRWQEHCSDANKRCGMCRIFHAAIRKYGEIEWDHEILFESDDRSEALKKETLMIILYKTTDRDYGYNITLGGEIGNYGLKMPDHIGKAISERQRGKNNPSYGRKQSDKEKKNKSDKMKEWHKNNKHPRLGVKDSDEKKLRYSIARKGEKNHFFGKRHKPETIKLFSENNPCLGMWGWMNPCTMKNENAMNIYLRADIYFEWWNTLSDKNAKRGAGADTLCKVFNEKRSKPHLTIIDRFRAGWNPNKDNKWLDFKNARTLAA